MREVLFRGRRLDSGEWVYGSFWQWPDGDCVIVTFMDSRIRLIKVDPATVGQWTGGVDKNGTKIWEGDVCIFSVFDCFDNDKQYQGIIVYSGSRFMLWHSADSEYYGPDGGFDLDWVLNQDDEFEVISNIHDNLEMVGED